MDKIKTSIVDRNGRNVYLGNLNIMLILFNMYFAIIGGLIFVGVGRTPTTRKQLYETSPYHLYPI